MALRKRDYVVGDKVRHLMTGQVMVVVPTCMPPHIAAKAAAAGQFLCEYTKIHRDLTDYRLLELVTDEDLATAITNENLHPETSTGSAVGAEVLPDDD